MKIFPIGTHIKASVNSRHAGYTGTVVDPNGQYLLIRSDEDSPNPFAWKSITHGKGKFFCIDRNFVLKVKAPK